MANEHLKVFQKDSEEHKNLETMAALLNKTDSALNYTVEETYYDCGANWMYTTLIAHDPKEKGILASYQALNPRQQKMIVFGTDDDRQTVLAEIMKKRKGN